MDVKRKVIEMEKIKKLYLELSSKEYGKLHSIGWLLLSSLLVAVAFMLVLIIISFWGNFELSDVLEILGMLFITPLLALGVVVGRIVIKALSLVLVFMENVIIKGIIYVVLVVIMVNFFGAVLGDSSFLPDSEVLQYLFMAIFDAVYIFATIALLKCKNIKQGDNKAFSNSEINNTEVL